MADDLIVTQQEPIPPATEIDCMETNKVFDECLIRQCFPFPPITVGINPGCITGLTCSDISLTVPDPIVPARMAADEPGFVRISFHYFVNFIVYANTKTSCTPVQIILAGIIARENNVKLYCPEPIAYILSQQGTAAPPAHLPNETIKLEFIGECVETDFVPNPIDPTSTDVNISFGYYIAVKCEQVAQIQVLGRGYCAAPLCKSPAANPCDEFNQRLVPSFFPAQRSPF